MKLNYKRTILIGFAFFLICAFWQAYDATIPVILINKFGMSQTWSGVIMALDNFLAIFMLPLFGTVSDKCKSRFGKRTPFVAVGTLIAALALVALSFVDNAQLQKISSVSEIDSPKAMSIIYQDQAAQTLQTPEGELFKLSDLYTEEEFCRIQCKKTSVETGKSETNPEYTNYVAPARQAYVAKVVDADPSTLIVFTAFLLIILLSMSVFRSPAVALMPDVTIKPLRSKANAVINLMGTAGGILVLVLGIVFSTSAVQNAMMSYTVYYGVIAAIMILALAVFLLWVREPKWSAQMQEESLRLGIEEEVEDTQEKRKFSTGEKVSLGLILASIALWYFGYNAVTSKYSVYATNILGMDYNTTMLIAQAAAIVSYLPAGMLASKIGRRKSILAGVFVLAVAFGSATFMRAGSPIWLMNLLFALAGIGWATINVNSFPMVVEMCSGGDIGKYTGYYYTASMAAQIATPVLSGFLMDQIAETVLFPYAAVFVALSFVTMAMVRHGDAKVAAKMSIEDFAVED